VRRASRGEDDLIGAQFLRFIPNYERPAAIEHKIDLVFILVRVDFLFLPGLEAVNVTEEISGFEEVDLLHLVGRKTRRREYVFRIHIFAAFEITG
jgi:hypothetical protein